MATEIAKAYVQIMPSADGIKDKLEEVLGKEIPESGESAGRSFGSSFMSVAGKVVSAAAIGKVISQSFTEGAAIQQSLGGVETMFKENADKVVSYANRAYETAGLSANEYMEQVTSFSATLLQGLGGDTERAAELADRAMVDMSDNANKFGTDITSIQDAYQGFAKSNFTMLDNLKLGYGGTQTEMIRLINDSGILEEKISSLDNVSFDQMIEAIHVIQTDLGVTGTTSEEAAETFSGSFAAMRASAKNLLGDMSAGTGDINDDVKALTKTTKTFVTGNLLPMGKQVLTSLDSLTGKAGALKSVIEGAAISFAAIKITNGTLDSVESLTKKLKESGGAAQSLKGFLSANKLNIGIAAAAAAGELIASYVDKQTEKIQEAVDTYDSLTEAQKELVDNTENTLDTINRSFSERSDVITDIQNEAENCENLKARLFELNDMEELDAGSKAELKSIVDELNGSVDGLNIVIDENTGRLKTNKKAIEKTVKSYTDTKKVSEAGSQLAKINEDLAKAEKLHAENTEARSAAQEKYNRLKEEYNRLANADTSGMSLEEKDEFLTYAQDNLPIVYEAMQEAENQLAELNTAWDTSGSAVEKLNNQLNENKSIIAGEGGVAGAAGIISDCFWDMAESAKAANAVIIEVGENTYSVSQGTASRIQEISDSYNTMLNERTDQIFNSLNLFEQFPIDAEKSAEDLMNAMDSNLAGLQEWSDGIAELTERGVSKGLIDKLKEAGPSSATEVKIMADMTEEQLQEYSDKFDEAYKLAYSSAERELSNMKDESAEQIQSLIDQAGEYEIPMEEAYEILGKQCSIGFSKGMLDNIDSVETAAQAMVYAADSAVRYAAEIASPAKLFRREGAFIPDGLALGIDDGADSVFKAGENLIDGMPNLGKRFESAIAGVTRFDTSLNMSGLQADTDSDGATRSDPITFVLTDEAYTVLARAMVDQMDILMRRKMNFASRS